MPGIDLASAQISYQVPPDLMEQVKEILDLNRSMIREISVGRYLTTAEAAKYLKRSEHFIREVVAKQVPCVDGNPITFDIRDLDAWFARRKKTR